MYKYIIHDTNDLSLTIMRVVFLLGAGFSMPSGYPSGSKLNEKFFVNLENRILRFSSGEYTWDEYGETAAHNGRLNTEFLKISYLLSELVEQFQVATSKIFDYEAFYDWFLSKWENIEFMKQCCKRVNDRIIAIAGEKSNHIFREVDINQYIEILKCYNHLIADVLNRPYRSAESLSNYNAMINIINQAKDVDFFTLNHDLLIEYILDKNGLLYSDGFSTNNSCIIGDTGEKLPIFDNQYNSTIKIRKLHGSVDYFLFKKMNQTNNYYADTGEYWFFKPGNYDNKHDAKRIDPESGKIVQDYNFDITPQCLTGKSKFETIQSHAVYKPLYEAFENSFKTADKVIIIGYSYQDNHINSILKNAIDNFSFELINVNPNTQFPFRKNYSQDFVRQLQSIRDL